ncbi:MAG: Uma2 family endonuclease, partial [Bacteroidetes bacterium]
MQNPTFTLSDYAQFCEKASEYSNFFEFANQQIVDRHSGIIVPNQVIKAVLEQNEQEFTNIYQVTMATFFHLRISSNIEKELWRLLEDLGFEIYADGCSVYIKLTNKVRIPDVVLVKINEIVLNEFDQLNNPLLVVEVLSPSTQKTDFNAKLTEYQSIPSLQEYLIVSQNEAKIWQYAR